MVQRTRFPVTASEATMMFEVPEFEMDENAVAGPAIGAAAPMVCGAVTELALRPVAVAYTIALIAETSVKSL